MSTLPALPLALQVVLRAPSAPGRHDHAPVPGAYCLIDADGSIGRQKSGSQAWELACRTTQDGTLVTGTSQGAGRALFDNPDPGSWRPQWARPVPILLSRQNDFNLFWTRNRALFDLVRKSPPHWASLNRCRGLLYHHEAPRLAPLYVEAFAKLSSAGKISVPRGPGQTQKAFHEWLVETYGFHAGGERLSPVPVHYNDSFSPKTKDEKGQTRTFNIPYIDLEDTDLKHALKLADRIQAAAAAPAGRGLYDDFARIETALKALDAYETRAAAGDGDWINTIRERHLEYERKHKRYSSGRKPIERSIRYVKAHVEKCGAALFQLMPAALLQLAAHHPRRAAQEADRLFGAAALYLGDRLCTSLLESEGAYRQALGQALKTNPGPPASRGEEPQAFWAWLVGFYREDLKSGQKAVGLLNKTTADGLTSLTRWLFASVAARGINLADADATKAFANPRLTGMLNRANHLIAVLGSDQSPDSKVPVVVKLEDPSVKLEVKLEGKALTANKVFGLARKGVSGLDQVVKCLNFVFAMNDLRKKEDFKTLMNAAKSTADVTGLLVKAHESLEKGLGVKAATLTWFAASVTCFVALLDATRKHWQGNNVAALGHLLEATGGLIVMLFEGGPAGWVAAGFALTGVLVVYWSLDDEERFFQSLEAPSRFYEHITSGPRYPALAGTRHVLPRAQAYLKDTGRAPSR